MNLGAWRAATSGEINTGQLPAGASLRQVVTAGGDRKQKVLKKASAPETVTTTGNPVIQGNDDGSKTYTFLGGGTGSMRVLSRTGNVVHENQDYTSAYNVDYKVSSFSYGVKKAGTVCIYSNGAWTPVAGGGSNVWYSNVSYSKSTLTVTGVDTGAGSAQLKFTPNDSSGGGGTVKVTPYTKEETTDQAFGYYTHIPASAEAASKAFLVQQGSAAAQNFAFDMDDADVDFAVE